MLSRRRRALARGAAPSATASVSSVGKATCKTPPRSRRVTREAAVREHLQHLVVLAEHVGLELRDAAAARDRSQVLEQHRADAPALVRVGDRERDLGAPRPASVRRDVAADADDALLAPLAQRRDQRHAAHEVELGEVSSSASRQPRFAPKNRKYTERALSRWKCSTRRARSSGRMARMWIEPPSRRISSTA